MAKYEFSGRMVCQVTLGEFVAKSNAQDLIWLQHEFNCIVFDRESFRRLFKNVYHIGVFKRKSRFQFYRSAPTKTFIEAHDRTASIFSRLYGFYNSALSLQADEWLRILSSPIADSFRWNIKLVCLGYDIAFTPVSAMREKSVGETVLTKVGGLIGIMRSFKQGKSDLIVTGPMTVFAVIQQSNAVVGLGNIYPFVSTDFKACDIPTRVPAGRTAYISVLNITADVIMEDIQRKMRLDDICLLLPNHMCSKVNAGRIRIK